MTPKSSWRYMTGLVHTCGQNRERVSIDRVPRLFIDKLRTNRLFCNYLQIGSLWSPTKDGNLDMFCNFSKCEASLRKNNLWKTFAKLHQIFRKLKSFVKIIRRDFSKVKKKNSPGIVSKQKKIFAQNFRKIVR